MARVKSSLVTGLSAIIGSEEFVIVELTKDGQRPVYDRDGQLLKFKTGEDASVEARRMTVSGRKFQPRRVKDDGWQDREKARFASKEYRNLPWFDAVWWKANKHLHDSHFPHVSLKNSVGLMAFTESEDKGSADVQTAMKPGKYLERYFSDILDPYIIRDLCTIFSNVFEDNCLLFADTEDEFEALYTTGPSSCMSHPKDKFTSHIHPVRVYAAGDLALVYMKRDGRIVARALCWPAQKTYSRIYGDVGRIEPLLQKEGFKKKAPYGAKLQRIITWEKKADKSGNQAFVAPHIDDINYLMDEGTHLIIGDPNVSAPKKAIKLTGASGVTEWISIRCACGKETTKSGLTPVYIDNRGTSAQWCADCVAEKAFKCVATGGFIDVKLAVVLHDGSKMWKRSFDEGNGFTCEGNGLKYLNKYRTEVKTKAGRNMVVSTLWAKEQQAAACKVCGSRVVGGACDTACSDKFGAKRAKQEAMYGGSATNAGIVPGAYATYSQASATGVWLNNVEPPRRR